METWKKIKGFEGYEVSDLGRVRTKGKITHTEKHGERRWQDRILKQKTCRQNCRRVSLWKDGKAHYFLVHRLVAAAFLGEPEDEKMTVNHKDGNRLNNRIENLEWLSLSDNLKHAYKNGLMKQKKCMLISEKGEEKKFLSLSEASRAIGRGDSYISKCKKANRKIKGKDGTIYFLLE